MAEAIASPAVDAASPAVDEETSSQVPKFERLPGGNTPKQKIKLKKDAVSKAVKALKQLYSRQCAESAQKLLANDTKDVFVDVSFQFMISKKHKAPVTFLLPHPIWDDETDICVFTRCPKDKYKTWLLDEQQVPRVKKIIDMRKVNNRYVNWEDKINLSKAYDVFVCDAHIYDRVTKQLGPEFRRHNKVIPYPMLLERAMLRNDDPKQKFENLLRMAQFKRTMGRRTSIKIGDFNLSEEQLCENAFAAIKGILRWNPENMITHMNMKFADGNLLLPIYRRPNTPGELLDLGAWAMRANSSSASDTGASGISDTEITAGTSDAGETLSTRDTTSENETGDEISASILETESSLVESESGDVDSSSAPPTPTKVSKKKKKSLQEKSSDMPPPKKQAKKQ